MRKFTFMILAVFMAVMAYAQKPMSGSRALELPIHKAIATQSTTPLNAGKLANKQLAMPYMANSVRSQAPRRVAEPVTPPTGEVIYYTLQGTNNRGSGTVTRTVKVIFDGNDVYVTGLCWYVADAWAKGTIENGVATFAMGQYMGDPGAEVYLAGTDDGSTLTDVIANYDVETRNFEFTTYILDNKDVAEGLGFYAYWSTGVTLTKIEGEVDLPVEAPEGLETEEFTVKGLSYDYNEQEQLITTSTAFNVQAGFVTTSPTTIDIYVQGLCSYLPEAWVKGTGEVTEGGIKVTFPTGQLFGTYASSYVMWFVGLNSLEDEAELQDVVFDFDADSKTLTLLEGQYVAINGEKEEPYWYSIYSDLVISKVVEVAAMPANPEITDLKNSNYGYIITFNVPAVDTEGNGLVSSKLFYQIYTDTEGEVSALTFTPQTHVKLTEDMTVIPYGFTDNYDFGNNTIYLNELYSADWNKLGIKSIYYGGGETNETEIQWYEIKPYGGDEPAAGHLWIAEDQEYNNQQTITDITIDEGITGVFAQGNGANPSRYYNDGTAVRAYAGNTLTLTSEGEAIVKVEFTFDTKNGSKMPAFDVEVGEMTIAEDGTTGEWVGEANEIVFSVPNTSGQQTRVQSIKVILNGEEEGGGEEEEDELVVLPEGVEAQEYTLKASGATSQGTITIEDTKLVAFDGTDVYVQGLAYYFPEAFIKGELNTNGKITFKSGQFVGEDEDGKEYLVGVSIEDENNFVYEEEIVFDFDAESGVISLTEGTYYGESGQKDEADVWDYFESATFTPGAPVNPDLVVLPEGIELEEYSVSARNYNDNGDVNRSIFIGFDGSDVYIQGLCSYLPESCIKGTIEGNVVTFAHGQYFGTYGNTYDMYLNTLLESDVIFDYDSETGTFTAQNECFLVDNDSYYFDSYRGAVFKKVVETAAMPANPEITDLKNSSYGYYITFNVPAVDTEGNGLVSSKLFYQIYTDIEGEISALTFTPQTHSKLTEDMTVIPYGFTEDYDFYDNAIYLNDLYSADWNKLGIKSIYYGGGETHETEIQWYEIKPYGGDEPAAGHLWVAEDQEYNNQQTITDITIDEGITGVFAQGNGANPSRYYNDGTAVRAYAGNTLTLTSEGEAIVKVEFTFDTKNGSKMPAFDVEVGEMTIAEDGTTGEWVGEANEIVFSVPNTSGQQTRVQSIKVILNGEEEGGGEEEEDELVVLPEGVEAQEYTLKASGATSQGTITIEDTKLVAFDGTDVYVQGLAYYFPEAFIKGELNDNGKITFKSGQFVGEDEYGKEYLIGISVDEGNNFVYEEEIVFDFDAESGVISLTEGTYYGESEAKDEVSIYDYFETAVYTPGALVIPDLVVLPEGVETQVWTLEASFIDDDDVKDVQRQTEVAFDGTDIYIKGLSYYFEDAWLKGTLNTEEGVATFPTGQFVGKDEYGMEFMVGYGEQGIEDIEFYYDADAKTLTQKTEYILENQSAEEVDPYGYWTNAIYYEGEAIVVEPVVAPEGLETETYLFTAMEIVDEEEESYEVRKKVVADNDGGNDEEEDEIEVSFQEYSHQIEVGFDGNDVYFKGFSDDTAEMWAKGTLSGDGKTVTIPANQFMGNLTILWYSFNYYLTAVADDLETMEDIVLNYDAETNTFSTDQFVVINGAKRSMYPYQTFTAVEITKMIEVAATPADPAIDKLTLEGTKYPNVDFIIPATDTEGNAIIGSKLFYQIWIEKVVEGSNVQEPLTLAADLYTYMDEDMTEIPYTYDDSYDIYAYGERVYLNQPAEEIASWKKIGVQSIYYGGGECNKSNIVWSEELNTGINDMSAVQGKAVYYDLQGRVASAQTKGLLIKQVSQADGTVKTVKVIRK